MFYNSISPCRLQDDTEIFEPDQILVDKSSTGKDRRWRERKMANELLALAYDSIDEKKAMRLRDCAKMLTYRVYDDGQKRIDSISSCRVRLCPICAWRRSLKVFYNTQKIIEYLNNKQQYNYIFLTLTMRNCKANQLNDTLDLVFKSWNRFMQLDALKSAVKGWYRGVEITHDTDEYITDERYKRAKKYYDMRGIAVGDYNDNFDTYHPHIHCILVVNKSYFTSRQYISQDKFSELWAQSARLDYKPICDIRKIKGDYNKAVAELSKYSCKTNDYIITDDWDLTVESVRTLDVALRNRRLVAYGGIMRDVNKLLKLEDADNGSLLDVGEQADKLDGDYFLESYFWYSGYRQYYKIVD